MPFLEEKKVPAIFLFVLALGLYANTLQHGFVLDDRMVLTHNNFVKQGIAGFSDIFSKHSFAGYDRIEDQQNALAGGRYRPLSLAVFAVLYSVFGENPLVFHGLSILLYAITSVLLYRLLQYLLKGTVGANQTAWLAALIFVVHPVHTEVVANVKSCDEQLAVMMGLGAWLAMLRGFDAGKKQNFALAAMLFLLACLAKENAVLLVFIVPVSLWFFRQASIASALRHGIPLFVVAGLYVFLRSIVTASSGEIAMIDPLNNTFLIWNGSAWLPCSSLEKAATVIYTLGLQLRLLVFPYPLTHDYYHLKIQSFASPGVWLSLAVLALLIAHVITGFRQKKASPSASATPFQLSGFGIFCLLATLGLTANILFPIGAFMAERFLYLPSIGFCLAAAAWGKLFFDKYAPRLVLPIFGLVALVFSLLTILRNPAWKDDLTLHRSAIVTSTDSPKLNNDLGTLLLEKAMKTTEPKERQALLDSAYPLLEKALEKHPTYFDAYLATGACAYYLGKFDRAISAYEEAVKLSPADPKPVLGLRFSLQAYADSLATQQKFQEAIAAMTQAWEMQQDTLSATHLSSYYRSQNDLEKSRDWLEKALQLAPNDQRLNDILKNIEQ